MPDPVSSQILQAAKRLSVSINVVALGVGRVENHLQTIRNCSDSDLVGVGLSATLLLTAAAQPDGMHQRSMLALFPFLGVDAPPYGRVSRPTQIGDVLLYLGGSSVGRRVLSRVSISTDPMGLEGVYPPGSISWAHAASCMSSSDFVSLVVPPVLPVTVVLNRSAPMVDEARTEVLMSALNQHLSLGFAVPGAPDLSERVVDWLATGVWRAGLEVAHG